MARRIKKLQVPSSTVRGFRNNGNGFKKKVKKKFEHSVRGRRKPSRWKKGIICPLCRTGEKIVCANFLVVPYIL
jgi:hypothetical protein